MLYDPRPNSELLLATGTIPDSNPADHLMWPVSLLQVQCARMHVQIDHWKDGCGWDAISGPHCLQSPDSVIIGCMLRSENS